MSQEKLPGQELVRKMPVVRVEFYKLEIHGRRRCAWEATRSKRTKVPGTVMAEGEEIPHDLAQFVIEASTGYQHGFWGLVAQGATFKSTGRRPTKPGRSLIADRRDELAAAEQLAGLHLEQWRAKKPSAVTDALNRTSVQWQELTLNQRLAFEWPSPVGTVDGS